MSLSTCRDEVPRPPGVMPCVKIHEPAHGSSRTGTVVGDIGVANGLYPVVIRPRQRRQGPVDPAVAHICHAADESDDEGREGGDDDDDDEGREEGGDAGAGADGEGEEDDEEEDLAEVEQLQAERGLSAPRANSGEGQRGRRCVPAGLGLSQAYGR